MRYYFNDVFARSRYSGNQLATFLDCDGLDGAEMQRIAREVNFSETTFITDLNEKDGGYDVRIFTPNREVEFAGHPTLGTADVIRRHVIGKEVDRVVLNLKVGQVPVDFTLDDMAWMRQVPPRFGKDLEKNEVARALGVKPDAIDARWPIQEVSTGFPHIIVPILGLKTLKKVKVDMDRYMSLVRGGLGGERAHLLSGGPGAGPADQRQGVPHLPRDTGGPGHRKRQRMPGSLYKPPSVPRRQRRQRACGPRL